MGKIGAKPRVRLRVRGTDTAGGGGRGFLASFWWCPHRAGCSGQKPQMLGWVGGKFKQYNTTILLLVLINPALQGQIEIPRHLE